MASWNRRFAVNRCHYRPGKRPWLSSSQDPGWSILKGAELYDLASPGKVIQACPLRRLLLGASSSAQPLFSPEHGSEQGYQKPGAARLTTTGAQASAGISLVGLHNSKSKLSYIPCLSGKGCAEGSTESSRESSCSTQSSIVSTDATVSTEHATHTVNLHAPVSEVACLG